MIFAFLFELILQTGSRPRTLSRRRLRQHEVEIANDPLPSELPWKSTFWLDWQWLLIFIYWVFLTIVKIEIVISLFMVKKFYILELYLKYYKM